MKTKSIKKILDAKRHGKDCTQEESAKIKKTLRDILSLFPLEWDEAIEEFLNARKLCRNNLENIPR